MLIIQVTRLPSGENLPAATSHFSLVSQVIFFVGTSSNPALLYPPPPLEVMSTVFPSGEMSVARKFSSPGWAVRFVNWPVARLAMNTLESLPVAFCRVYTTDLPSRDQIGLTLLNSLGVLVVRCLTLRVATSITSIS